MLILPAVILLINYVYSRQLLEEENLNYQNAVLVQAQTMIDEKLQSLQLFAIDASNDTTINDFLNTSELSGGQLNMAMWELSGHMRTFTAPYRNLCETFIYSVNYDALISVNSVDSTYSEKLNRLGSKHLNQLLQEQLLNKRLYSQYKILRDRSGNSELVLFHSVPLWSTGRAATGAISLLIDTDELFRNISRMEEFQSGVVVLLDDQNLPFAYLGNIQLLENIEQLIERSNNFVKVKNERFTISIAESKINDWKYLSVQPEHVMLSKLQTTRNLILLAFFAVLSLGVVLAYALSCKNYKPVENLLSALRKQSILLKEKGDERENEFHLIERSVTDIARSMTVIQDMLHEELPRLQESVLIQLLKNAVPDYAAFKNTLADIGVMFPYGKFSLVIIRLVRTEKDVLEEWAISSVVLKKQLMEIMPSAITYATVMPQPDALVVIMNSNLEPFEDTVKEVFQKLVMQMRNDFSQMISVFISRTVKSLDAVPHAYYTASQMPTNPNGGLLFQDQMRTTWRVEQNVEEISSLLQNYILTGDAQSALAMLKERKATILDSRNLELYYVRAYYISLLNIVMNAYPLEEANLFGINGVDPLQLLFTQTSAEEMQETVEALTIYLCEQVQKNQKSHAAQFAERMISFIKDELTNEDLALSYVAEHFYITPSYLSTFFKENVGDTFLNYVTRLRVEKAKELIKTTEMTMTEISSAVGYASGNTFTRIFKKAEGITPSQYRENIKR